MKPFCWHKWSKWSEVLRDYSGSLQQVCKCEKCGAITKRTAISIYFSQLQSPQVNEAIKKLGEPA